YDKTFVVAHDIGNTVPYAYAAMYPDKVERLVVMDAPIPGIEPWNEVLLDPRVWHFNFHGPDAERLVAGRERIYLDRIWNDFSGGRYWLRALADGRAACGNRAADSQLPRLSGRRAKCSSSG